MKKFLRILLKSVSVGAVLALALTAYVGVVGIPRPMVRHYLRRFEREQGVRVTVDRLRWAPWHHVTAEGVCLSVPGSGLSAAFLSLGVETGYEQNDGEVRRMIQCRFSGGRLELPRADAPVFSTLELPHGVVSVVAGKLTRVRVQARAGDGWKLDLSGSVRAAPLEAKPQGLTLGDRLTALWDKAHATLRGLEDAHVTAYLPQPLNAQVTFDVDAADVRHSLAFEFMAAPAEGISSDAAVVVELAHGSYTCGVLDVKRLRVSARDPGATLPENVLAAMAGMGFRPVGALRADVAFGPAPWTNALDNISGRIQCEAAEYRGAQLEQLGAEFCRRTDGLQVSGAVAMLKGPDADKSVRAEGTVGPHGAYRIELRTDAAPQQLVPLLPAHMAALAESLTVHGESRIEATLSNASAGASNPVARCRVHVTDAQRHEVPVALLDAVVTYSNGLVRVDDLVLVRSEGQVTGRLDYDTVSQRLGLDVRTTASPAALARFVGPGLERIVSDYRLEGATTVVGKGSIGLGDAPVRDLRLHVTGEQIGWRWFLADRAELDMELRTSGILVDVLSAQWCRGDVSGSLRFEFPLAATGTPARCSMELLLVEAKLASIADVFQDLEDKRPYEGILSGQIALSGAAGPEFLQTATGTGRIDIQDGYILSLPLLGGLSKYLSLLIPGLGYANQRDLRSSFQIRDGRLETSDTQLLGRFITIWGKGSYTFKNDLNFRVQVQFLKEGLTATITRLLTSPLTKALEFELTGTPKTPRWRPVNTPNRLFDYFNEKLGTFGPAKPEARPDDAAAPARQTVPE